MKKILVFSICILFTISVTPQRLGDPNPNFTSAQPNDIDEKEEMLEGLSVLSEQVSEVESNMLDNSLKFYSILISVIIGIVAILMPLMMFLQNRKGITDLQEKSDKLLKDIKKEFDNTIDKKVNDFVQELMTEKYEAFIFQTSISYTQEVLGQGAQYKQVLYSRNRSLIKEIDLLIAKNNIAGIQEELEHYNDDWYVLSRVFSGDEKQLTDALNDYIGKRAFSEFVPALENLQKRKANNPEIYNLITKALDAGYELL